MVPALLSFTFAVAFAMTGPIILACFSVIISFGLTLPLVVFLAILVHFGDHGSIVFLKLLLKGKEFSRSRRYAQFLGENAPAVSFGLVDKDKSILESRSGCRGNFEGEPDLAGFVALGAQILKNGQFHIVLDTQSREEGGQVPLTGLIDCRDLILKVLRIGLVIRLREKVLSRRKGKSQYRRKGDDLSFHCHLDTSGPRFRGVCLWIRLLKVRGCRKIVLDERHP